MTSRRGHIVCGGTASARAMIRRMKTARLALIPAEPAARTPAQVMTAFFEEHEIDVSVAAVAELSSRLHEGGVLYFADDGALQGSLISETLTAIGEALGKQADLIAENRWPERNRLRMLAERYRLEVADTLGELGMG